MRGVARFVGRYAIALAVAAGLVLASLIAVDRVVQQEVDRIPRVAVQTAPEPSAGANYLVVGSDSRAFVETEFEEKAFGDPDKETGRRSDTMMVVHVEPDAERTLILSFPRDLWVDIPGIGNAKINAAFNSELGGGPDSIIAALKQNFDIDINHYLEVDFVSFREIVDSVGTVPVYVDRPVIDDFTGFIVVKPGCYRLDGTDALAYVRSRHLRYLNPRTGRMEEDPRADIGRIERQQDFIRRMAGAVVQRSLHDPFKAREITQRVVDHLRVDDDFDKRDALDLVAAFRSVNPDDTSALEFVTFPFTEGNAGGQAVLFPDKSAAAPLLDRVRRFDVATPVVADDPSSVRVRVLNGASREGMAQDVMSGLVAAGFENGGTGNDERGRVSFTEVRYASGAEAKARLLLEYVGAGAKLVGDPNLKGADVTVVLGADFAGLHGAASGADAGGASAPDAGAGAPADPDPAAAAAAACR
ncbi:MAG: hypothetical protein AMXMBFR46_19320 [Acidimicrobiia bacterium]